MGVLWADWIAQPPEHRELYRLVSMYQDQMNEIDDEEKEREREREERRLARHSQRGGQ